MKSIHILVDPHGQTSVETIGFSGAECQSASRFLEQALGQRQQEKLTADFYRQATTEPERARHQR